MSLITLDELARGACIGVFGGLAGLTAYTLAPGTPLWLLPAAAAVGGSALTVPEVRQELARALPYVAQARAALPAVAWQLPGVKPQQRPQVAEGRSRAKGRMGTGGAPGAALRPAQWLQAVNDRPDDNPHMTVVGPSGSGKTTFVSAALGKRPGRTVVLTPKVTPGAWRGAEVVTLGEDLSYDPLAQALEELQLEARRRSVALKRGEPLEPLTVVLDELPELHAEIPGAGKFAVRLSRWGRELGMRQVVIATSDDALNIPGWAATRPNYVRVELARPAEDGTRQAWLDDGQSRRPLDLGSVKAGAERAQLRPWRGEEPAPRRSAVAAEGQRAGTVTMRVPVPASTPAPVDSLLASLLAESVPAHQDAEGTGVNPIPGNGSNAGGTHSSVTVEGGGGQPVTVNATLIAGGQGAKDRTARTAYERALVEVYRALGAENVTFAKAYAQHKGTKEIVFTAWQEGRATRQERTEA